MTFLETALELAARGWYVFPLGKRGKFPIIPKVEGVPGGLYLATRDPEQIKAWWAIYPYSNVGIACGASKKFVVDCDHGLTCEDDFHAWRMRNNIPVTYTVRTGRRKTYGVQMYFEGELPTNSPWELDGCKGEIRSAGGYVMAVGNIHPDTGERYEVLVDAPIAPRPAILEQAIKAVRAEKPAPGDPLVMLGKGEGRHQLMMQELGLLHRTGFSEDMAIGAIQALSDSRFTDPIPSEEIEATVKSCYAKWAETLTPPTPIIGKPKTATVEVVTEDEEQIEAIARPDYPDSVWEGTFYGEFADMCSRGNFVPKKFFSEALRTVVGAVVGNRLTCPVDGANARSYTILITNPGGGKGTACDRVRDLFAERWEGLKYSAQSPLLFGLKDYDWRTTGLGAQIINPASAPGLMKALEPRKRKKDEEPNPMEVWKPIPRAITIMEEARGLFANFQNEATGAGLESVICELYDRTSFSTTATKDRQPVSGELMYSILGGITKEGWDGVFSKLQSTESGFLSRVNIIGTEDARRVSDLSVPDFGPLRLRLFPFIQALEKTPRRIVSTAAARAVVSEWFNALVLPDGIQKSRLNIHAWRVALHRAWLLGHEDITEDDATCGVQVAEYQARMREYYAPAEGDTRQARCEATIRKVIKARRKITRRELQRVTNYQRAGIDTWDKALKALERGGELRLEADKANSARIWVILLKVQG